MSMVIVTSNHYIIASRILHITLDEIMDWQDVKSSSGRYKSVPVQKYTIQVVYAEDGQTNNNRDIVRECNISLSSKADAHRLYRDLISQIREQMPDQLYLDQAVERLLNQYNPEKLEQSQEKALAKSKELLYDRKPSKVRSSRKAKRTS